MAHGASGAEQAGDTRLPAVFFSRSLKATLAALQSDLGADNATTLQNRSLGHIQCLLPEGFTEFGKEGEEAEAFEKGGSKPSSAMQQQKKGMQHVTPDAAKTQNAASRKVDVDQQGRSLSYGINDNHIIVQAAALSPSTDDNCGSHDYSNCAEVIKLLAHVAGGSSVQHAVQHQHKQIGKSRGTVVLAHGKPGDDSAGAIAAQAAVSTGQQPSTVPEMQQPSTVPEMQQPSIVPEGQQPSAVHTTKGQASAKMPVTVLAVGPEGGWDDSEITSLTNVHGFQTVTIADGRTLDTTTAVVALVSLALDAVQAISADSC